MRKHPLVHRSPAGRRRMQKLLRGISSGLLITTILALFPVAAEAANPYRVISRSEWGADESFLYVNGESEREITDNDKTSDPETKREKDCAQAHEKYPDEFVPARTVRKNGDKTYRWALQYSKDVKLLVVHHTAIQVTGDDRSAEERMRALYQMHANGNGWGDIGYHYVVGDDGKIFEGKAGGDYVAGGHVYCGNLGTVGISLMGNFDVEKPTQAQMRSLQWLLITLGKRYKIDPDGTTLFHGKEVQTVLGHRNLLPTDCPGFYVAETLNQVRTNVARSDYSTAIRFPVVTKSKSAGILAKLQKARLGVKNDEPLTGVIASGSTEIEGRPGDSAIFAIQYRSGNAGVNRRTRIADVSRSSNRLGLSQELGSRDIAIRSDVLLPEYLRPRSVQTIRLKVRYPIEPGTYTATIGGVEYTFNVTGRRTRAAQLSSKRNQALQIANCKDSAICNLQSSDKAQEEKSVLIRIRLSTRETGATSCAAVNLNALKSQYRGTLECKVLDGKAAIINELPIEDYLAGLAEEPDTEPYEKQRAFAIAARTYAAFYLQNDQRKFPGMPYDGDDSPARFQSYKGMSFELKNPSWVKAVRNTAAQVLMIGDALIKPPYFSSDDGRTRSPEEAGWNNFPNAEIFKSKPDPWCKGMSMAGHGVGMSGCGAEGQAEEGKTGEQILEYYYPGTVIKDIK
ncbi:MAG: N-acetylmuramoyl-L-alanine amidase [Patescibacteria group bacterium]